MNGKDYTNKMSKIQDLTVREHTARLQSLIGKTVSYLSAETGTVIEGKLVGISGETAIISNGWANLWEVVESDNGQLKIIDSETKEVIGKVITNQSLTFDQVMELAGFDYIEGDNETGWSKDGGKTLYDEETAEIDYE